jgi:hypothetical protein
LTGLSKAQIRENITAAIAKNELPVPEAGAISYMMSKAGNLGDSVGHWCPHLMFSMFSRQTMRAGEQTWKAHRWCSTTSIATSRSGKPFSLYPFPSGQTAPLRHIRQWIESPDILLPSAMAAFECEGPIYRPIRS